MNNLLVAAFCVLLFSLTVPFTRIAALETDPITIIFVRLLGAGFVSVVLAIADGWFPPKRAWKGILGVTIGSVIGFSSFTALALKEVPSGHAAVGLAGLPMATAIYSVIRDRANPGRYFWGFALLGTFISFGFFFTLNVSEVGRGDFILVLAVLSAAFGYVEGGRATREFNGRRIMSWAVICTLPIVLPVGVYRIIQTQESLAQLSIGAWAAMIYLALVSQSTGMFLWFKVLAKRPMEKIALVQLLQPFLTLLASIIFLKEHVLWSTWIIAGMVAACIYGANKTRTA